MENRITEFISKRRRELGLTQQQLAEKLNISFQAVSKWETGSAYPSTEILLELSKILEVTVDDLLNGGGENLSYSKAGIDITYTDTIKTEFSKYVNTANPRVLNKFSAFASLYDINFTGITEPVLVMKSEEPGSKQKLAMEYGYTESICHDMINHLVNDIIVMGAKPLAVLDTIVCGNAEKDTIVSFIKGMSQACEANECVLIGGETSIQPNVVDKNVYILTSSIAGIIDKTKIIDGSKISSGDRVIAVTSNGLHTNGYTLVRLLMDKIPQIKLERIGGETFIEQIMKPHTPYYKSVKDLFGTGIIKGMAHITGGGIKGNLRRIIPDGLRADIDLSAIKTLPIFKYIRSKGGISDSEMLSTFNCGVGMIIVTAKENAAMIINHAGRMYDCYEIGTVTTAEDEKVRYYGELK